MTKGGSEFYTLTTTASPTHPLVRPPSLTLRSANSSGYSSTRKITGIGLFANLIELKIIISFTEVKNEIFFTFKEKI